MVALGSDLGVGGLEGLFGIQRPFPPRGLGLGILFRLITLPLRCLTSGEGRPLSLSSASTRTRPFS